MSGPISPKDAQLRNVIPDAVFEAFNELIRENRGVVKQKDAVRCENGEMLLVRGPRPYLKMRDRLLESGMYIENRATLRRLANAILRELDAQVQSQADK